MAPKTVLITGANGYIGRAVAKSFVRAGWQVLGLVRRAEAMQSLESDEVVPILAKMPDPSFIEDVFKHSKTFEAIIGCADPPDYEAYFNESLAVIRCISEVSNRNGVRPLVLWTSGCKDYGTTGVDGQRDLQPHTEDSPLNMPPILIPRATFSLKMLEQTDLFDAAVLRPTNVFGYSSSYFGSIFEYAASQAAGGAQSLELADIDPNSIMHAMHVDDCGDAYLALVEHPDRTAVAGQCFNISAHAYETAATILEAVAKEYGFAGGSHFTAGTADSIQNQVLKVVFGFSQWVSSEKIRDLTGWADKRMLFSKNLSVYRRSYEAAVRAGHEDLARVNAQQSLWNSESVKTSSN